MRILNIVTLALIIIGGINWGLVGAFDFNLVDTLFGAGTTPARAVYILVGLAALYQIIQLFRCCCNDSAACRTA